MNFYAAPGSPYLAYLAFQKQAGIDTTFVAYNSPVNAIPDLSERRIHIAVMPLASILGAAQAPRLTIGFLNEVACCTAYVASWHLCDITR